MTGDLSVTVGPGCRHGLKNSIREPLVLLLGLFISFAEKRKHIGLFGGRDVVESSRFHPTLMLFYLKECQFYNKF